MSVEGNLMTARMIAHARFDQLWLREFRVKPRPPEGKYRRSNRRMRYVRLIHQRSRKLAYSWLAEQLQIPVERCHIRFFTAETCTRVLEICQGKTAKDLRE